jgi:hypothetical protein
MCSEGKMTMQITIKVPNDLGQQLQQFRDRLPEILERGLVELMAETSEVHHESAIVELLTSQPSPEQVMAIRPSPAPSARVSELLERSKRQELDRREERELERYLVLEHLVRLAKAHAYRQLDKGPSSAWAGL